VSAAAYGPGAAQLYSFRDLLDVEAYEASEDHAIAIPMQIIDVGRYHGGLVGMLFFGSDIVTKPRRWWWSYRWPGMWSPLRDRHSDWCEYDTRPKFRSMERTKEMSMSFVFPSTAREPRVESAPNTPICVAEPELDSRTRGRTFTCRVADPHQDIMHWTLKVSGWD
jgi:hypothetical protein